MAEGIKTTYHYCAWDDLTSRIDKAKRWIAFLKKYGFASSGSLESSDYENEVLTLPSNPYIGLCYLYKEDNTCAYVVYKSIDGSWALYGNIDSKINGVAYVGKSLGICTIDGITRYTFHPHTKSSVLGRCSVVFATLPLIDYFSRAEYYGFVYHTRLNSSQQATLNNARRLIYDLNTKSVSTLNYLCVSRGIDAVPVTGYEYIAEPIIFYTSDLFYGYVNSSSTLYGLYSGGKSIGTSAQTDMPSDTEYEVGGLKFQELLPYMYIRR